MPGFHKGACAKPKNYANGGFVPQSKREGVFRGPGTGTSDSIRTEIPEGSYIMPADSTQQIGDQALSGLGKGIAANVSNGEYQIPPEQVHAIGVQTLEHLKAATHTPTPDPKGFKPWLFFEDGGLVEDVKKAFPSTAQAVAEYDPVGAYKAGGLPAAAGQTIRAAGTYTGGFLKDVVGRPLATAWDAAANTLKSAATGDSTPIPADQTARGALDGTAQPGAAPAAATTKAAPPVSVPSKPAASPPGAPSSSVTPPASSVPTAAGGSTPVPDQGALPNNIVKEGKNSYSGVNIGPDATLNGKPFGNATGTVSALDNAAMQTLANRYLLQDAARGAALAQAQAQPQGAGFRPNTGLVDERLAESKQDDLISKVSTPLKGSQNGQLTANQIRVLADIQNQGANRVTASANASMHDALTRELNAQNNAAAVQRALLSETGANQRFAATNALDQQKLNLAQESQGFQTRALKRQEDLTSKWEAAKTPEEKSAIAQQIRALSGKSDAGVWKPAVLQGGTDAMGNKTESVLAAVNEATGEMRRYDQEGKVSAAPKVGEVRNGFRFKGGDFNNKANWEKA